MTDGMEAMVTLVRVATVVCDSCGTLAIGVNRRVAAIISEQHKPIHPGRVSITGSHNVICEECGPLAIGVIRRLAEVVRDTHREDERTPPPPELPAYRELEPIEDGFLRLVAFNYRWAVNRGIPPAPLMCEQTGANTYVVHRWIRLARDREYLPVGKHGAVG